MKKIDEKVISEDVKLRENCRANIAKIFYDECVKNQVDDELPLELLHKISIKAADNLLDNLVTDAKIYKAAEKYVFYDNGHKWSNNDGTAGDNYGSFIAGVKWMLSRINKF